MPTSFATYELPVDKVIEYEFVIKNFADTKSQLGTDDFLQSPIFPQSDLPQWCVVVYPRGYGAQKFKFRVNVELKKARLGKTSEHFNVKFRFLNDNRSVILDKNFTSRRASQSVFFGIYAVSTKPIPVSDFGDLIVNVEIILKEPEPIVVSQTGNDINVRLIQILRLNRYKFKILQTPPSTISHDFATGLHCRNLSDFTVISSDKREFPTHKIILAMRFPQLERMFKSGWKEVKRKRVEVEFSGDCVEAVLEYVYGDKVAKLSGIVAELLQLARLYEIDRLIAICVAEMVTNVDEENLCEWLRIADLCGITPLQSACRKFIKDRANATKRICERETVPLPLSFATYDLSGNNKVVPYEFVVKNFATTQSQLDRIVKSPPFPKQSDLPQWRIYVFPRGVDTKKFKFQVVVGLLKEGPDKNSEIFAVKIQFLNDNRSVILKRQVAYEQGPQWGVVDYRIAADSTMAIPVSDSGDLIVSVEIRPDILGRTGYDINVPPSTFSHDFATALQSGILSDFTVVSSDQRQFPTHKIVLATRVPFFDRMFQSEMTEVAKKRVEVEFSGDCVEAMLEYVYNDKVVKLSGIVVELLQLARVYCIDRLVSICTAEMVKNLREENFCESLRIADLLGIIPLQSACAKFIADHPTMATKDNDTSCCCLISNSISMSFRW